MALGIWVALLAVLGGRVTLPVFLGLMTLLDAGATFDAFGCGVPAASPPDFFGFCFHFRSYQTFSV